MRIPAVAVVDMRVAGGAAVWTTRSNKHRGHSPPVAWLVTVAPQVGQHRAELAMSIIPSRKGALSFALRDSRLSHRRFGASAGQYRQQITHLIVNFGWVGNSMGDLGPNQFAITVP